MNLLRIADLTRQDIEAIWARVEQPIAARSGTVGWSFEGNGLRTRATFLQAFRDLGLDVTELPNLLKTAERPQDLAGYLDPFFSLYVIRESDHERLQAFAEASRRPVINAMSAQGHPCEVLTDAYFVDRSVRPLHQATVCLWGPLTNVFRSWQELGQLLGIRLVHIDPSGLADALVDRLPTGLDVVVTDGWPAGQGERAAPLTIEHLNRMGRPILLPTPPFTVGGELAFDPLDYPRFAGYEQKQLLLPIHTAILETVLAR